jgi:CheY-like chemotaxis protein
LGKGTTITILLPRGGDADEDQGVEQPAEKEALPQFPAAGDALLVEDNPEVKEVTVALLEQLAYRVQVADNADAALVMVEKTNFDVLVSDIVMAGTMDGLQLARTVRARHPHLPVVLVTGYSHSAVTAESDFIVVRKPYQPSDLSRAIARAIAEVQRAAPQRANGGWHG